ncbi:MAG TPA: hypothetical protein VJN69_02770 [Candidatus Acidoferrales bacterium]|nr:hypothetical protein [Candidatus Acidoferrales bacterium]
MKEQDKSQTGAAAEYEANRIESNTMIADFGRVLTGANSMSD